jgi:uncharacterized protein (TIGR02246 family)
MRYAKFAAAAAALILSGSSLMSAEEIVDGRRSIVLDGAKSRLVIDILGGSIVQFELKDHGLNPLRWANTGPTDQARQMSHFLCLDRWGLPSEAEAANGMNGHGEAGRVEWDVVADDDSSAHMSAVLPMAGLRVERQVQVAADGNWFHVTETVTNQNKLGRVYNMVQHPSIGAPFLDETVVVDSNASRGFSRGGSMPEPEVPSALWPKRPTADGTVDLRHLSGDDTNDVTSYIIEEGTGWVTAANPSKGLLIGYIWETEDYPWLNIWRRAENGKPLARGLEFGTTGLHEPYPTLIKKGEIFDRPLLDFLDASESHTRSYIGFLAEIPSGYQGVDRAVFEKGALTLIERGDRSKIELAMPSAIRGVAAASPPAPADPVDAVKQVVADYAAARDSRDPAAIAKLFTDDADQLVSSGVWRRGMDTLVQGMLGSSAVNPGGRTLAVETVRFVTDDVAIADARYEIAASANRPERKMWSSFLIVRSNDGWRISAIRNMLPAQ